MARTHSHDKRGTVAVFDIGGSSIGAALVSYVDENSPPRVHYATRALFPFLKNLQPDRLTQAMLSTFVVVALRLQREGLPRLPHVLPFGGSRVKEAVCFFSTPWHSSDVSSVVINKERPFTVGGNLADVLFPRDESFPHVEFTPLEEVSDKEKKKNSKNTGLKKIGDALSIERHVVRVYLNGYPVHKVEGKNAHSVVATVVGSVVPEDLFEKLRTIIDRVLRGGELSAHSFFLPLSRLASGVMGEESEYLLINVGGEVCDISVIHESVPTLFVSIPFGVQPLIRAVSSKAKIVPEEVSARLHQLAVETKDGGGKQGSLIVRTLTEVGSGWKDLVRDALIQSPFRSPLPNKVVVWSEPSYRNWFTHLFSEIALTEATFSHNPFVAQVLGKSNIANLTTFDHPEEFDEALAIETSFTMGE